MYGIGRLLETKPKVLHTLCKFSIADLDSRPSSPLFTPLQKNKFGPVLSDFAALSLYTALLVRLILGTLSPVQILSRDTLNSWQGSVCEAQRHLLLGSALSVPGLFSLKLLERVCCLFKYKEERWGVTSV